MPTIAEYEAWKSGKQANEAGKANIVLSQPFPTEPDQFAADTMFAREASAVVGNPVPMSLVQDPGSRSVFEQIIAEKKRSTVLTQSPRLSEWLRAPDNAAVARDNLEGLSWWEQASKSFEFGNVNAITQGQQFTRDLAAEMEGGPLGQAMDSVQQAISPLLTNPDGTPNWLGTLANTVRPADRQIGGPSLDAGQRREAMLAEGMGQIFDGARSLLVQMEQEGFSPTGLGDVNSIASFGQFVADQFAASLPQMLSVMASGGLTPLTALAQQGGAVNEELKTRTELSPDQRVAIATSAGTVMAALDIFGLGKVFEGLPLGQAVTDALDGALVEQLVARGVPSIAANALESALAEGTTEALQEGITVAVTALSGGEYTADEVGARLIESFVGGAAVGGTMRTATEAPATAQRIGERLQQQQGQAEQADAHVQTMLEMSQRAAADPVRNRMPDAFRDYLHAATANTGAENLFIPADQFVQYFQGAGVDPFELADQLTGMSRADVEMAAETGGSVKIPTATWAADMAGGEHDQFIISNSTFAPDAMTAQEAAEFNARAQEALQEAWEEAEALRIEAEELRQVYDQERDELIGRLRAAGRATDVATAEALPMVEFRRVMAERMGLTPEEFAARYPLPQVQGERPEGLDPKNVDELTRTLAEARNRRAVGLEKRGPSLLEFIGEYGGIIDPGGELRARDAAQVKRPGKKTLKLERGGARAVGDMFGLTGGKAYGFDDVARAAIEAGYLADDPVALEWDAAMRDGREVPDIGRALLDAIDRELRGEAEYAGQTVEVEDGLAGIEEYLSGLGLSLDDGDEAIRAAIEGQGREYGQADSGFTGGGRGSIQFPVGGVNQGETLVSLFQKADLSTFLHESGHYFLTVLQDAASLDPSSPLAGEFETIKAWWRDNADAVARDAGGDVTADDVRNAIDNGTSGSTDKDNAIDIGMQEQFARATEAYMLEGKAPSPSLRQAFEKFRAWLVSIYRTMRGLNVNVTDELRGVFDRMLATDDEIAAARQDIGADVALTAADLGMTDEQYENFIKLRDQAKADASAKLLAETMAPIKRAREKWFKDERKKVHADVERNTNAQPVYRAIEWMGNRRWLGEDAPEGLPDIRFSKDVLVQRYGEGVLSTLPRGQQTVYAVEGGLDPDDAAGWFGFSSGDAMVKAMERAPNRKELIEAETDKVMRERHGDVLRDGSVEQEAMEAVHTDSRGRELATELQALNAVAGLDRGLTAKDAREMARRTLSGMRTRDAMNAGRFLAAERKAGQEVARLTGTVTREGMWMDRARRLVETQARGAVREQDGAAALSLPVEAANQTTQRFNEQAAALVEAKRRQLLNHALYSEALAITTEVEKAERLASRLAKAIQRRRAQKGKQTISNDSLDAIAEILERYDFRRMSGPAEQRRGALNRYLESMVEQGRENEVSIPRKVLTDAAKVPYKTLLVGDLRGVVDTLRNLESTGRRWQKLLIAGKEREIAAAIDTITGSLKNNVGVKPAAWVEAGWQKTAGKGIKQYLATFTTASTVIRHMDGREDLGPVYELLKADIDNAAYTEREMREKAAEQIDALYSVYSEEEQREMAVMRAVPALGGRSFSKWNLIAMALNMGNAGNLHRLTNKKARQHLTPQQVEVVKGLLDKRDWDFVQSVWDYLDTYRPLIDERQKRTTGVSPEWVEATAVETPHGTYRGGYYPIKYAREQGGASTPSLDGDNDIIQSMKLGSYAKAATKNGHLEARVANVQQSLLLDVGVIGQHTNEVIHDLAFSESIVNSWRLLNDQRVSDALLDAGMQEQHEALKLWLKDVAVGQVFASDVLSRSLRTLRSGFTVSRLAFNVGTALLQPTGLMQSAVVVGKKNLASAITQYMRDPVGATNEVIGRSRIMGERRKVFQKDLMDMVAETNISAPTSSRFKKFMDRYAVPASLALMQYTQYYVVDVPTWMAAYSKGMSQFDGNQERAAQYADMTLNRVQGSGLWSERSNIERGTLAAGIRQNAFVTLFTTLGSYFFAKMNLLMERTNALRAEPVTAGAAFGYAFDVALLLAGEAAVLKLSGMAVEAALGGGDDEGEDENLALALGGESLKVFAAGLPGIRDGVSVFQGFSGGTYASLLDLMVRPAQQAAQGEFDAALVKSFVNLGGVVGRLPAAQANRIIDAAARQMDGQDVAPMEFLLGRPR